MPTFQVQPTPNPNSIKITTNAGAFIDDGMESFGAAQEAEGHPLGERLFNVPGVVNVFIVPQFVTVTKHPATDWGAVTPKLKSALAEHFQNRGT